MEKIMKNCIGVLTLASIAGFAVAGGPQTTGPDVQVCRLYDLDQKQRSGQLNGFSIATTSYNAGSTNLDWYDTPDENHPFITYNLFRVTNERCEQIGVSWIKHGFFATNTFECPQYNGCAGGGGAELKPDCADTYGSGLNGSLSYLGPRYEVDPWSGDWDYSSSIFENPQPLNSSVDRLMVIHDDELDASSFPGATFYAEGYYVAADDRKHMNSASHRAVGTPSFNPNGGPGNNYWTMSSSQATSPTIGFMYETWGGNESLISTSGGHPTELVDTDGRAVVTCKVFDNGDGTWDYEYLVYNIDLHTQVGSFEVPLPAGVNVSSTGFHAPQNHELMNVPAGARGSVSIDNAAWTSTVAGGKISWSSTTNPIRWGTGYNFRFTADSGPVDGTIDVGSFRTAAQFTTTNRVPMAGGPSGCVADFNNDGDVDLGDFGVFGAAFNSVLGDANYNPDADFNGDGDVDLGDFGVFGGEFNRIDC